MKYESQTSVAFVISQMQPRPPLPAHAAPRRTRSSPMLRKQRREAMVPFYAPTLERDFVTVSTFRTLILVCVTDSAYHRN